MNFYFQTFALLAAFSAPSNGMNFASKKAHELEKIYVEDCKDNTSPHGLYGAFLQPCEFTFMKNDAVDDSAQNACTATTSSQVGKAVPMHWFFNLTEHFDKDEWDNISSDDIPDADELMLWPDQCVGVGPRCYSLDEMNSDMKDILSRLFDEIPEGATHVQVDCRSDALELSRAMYALADGFEKSTPTIIAWMVTIVLLFAASTMWCCYGCCALFSRGSRDRACTGHHGNSSATYTRLEDACDHEQKEMYYPRKYHVELPQK
jgi:hypothetical protein